MGNNRGNIIVQAELIKFLETCEEPLTRKQIAEAMEENVTKISHALAVLIKWNEVQFIEHHGEMVLKLAGYNPGRRTRFYFVEKEVKKI